MPNELQAEMLSLWDEASVLLMTSRLDPTQAIDMMRKLLTCADRAQGAGYFFGERLLRRAAFDLQERIRSST